MAAIKNVMTGTYRAAVAITAGMAVKFTTNENEVTPTAAATDVPCGVAIEDQPTVGEGVSVQHHGEVWVNVPAAVAIGSRLMPTATAGSVDDTAVGTGSQPILGIALSNPGASGQARCLLTIGGFASIGTT